MPAEEESFWLTPVQNHFFKIWQNKGVKAKKLQKMVLMCCFEEVV